MGKGVYLPLEPFSLQECRWVPDQRSSRSVPPPPPPETVGARFDQPQAGTEEAPDREGHGGLSSLSHF